ncbi:MAG: cation:proton antiporter [Ignavibacteria bacterium]|nr:cation:proton antiporter [Ignavibacteria bacterium]
MDASLLIILLISIVLLAFHFINKKIESKLSSLIWFEFLIVGIIIGEPFIRFVNNFTNLNLPLIVSENNLSHVKNIATVVLGFVGFSIGMKFRLKELFNYSIEHFKLSLIDLIFTFVVLSSLSFLLINNFFNSQFEFHEKLLNALIVGIVSVTLSSEVLEKIKSNFKVEGSNFFTLSVLPKLNHFIAISVIGLIIILINSEFDFRFSVTFIELFLLSVLFGLIFGFFSFIFIEGEKSEGILIVSIFGIVILISGLATNSHNSPIFLNFIVGFIIGNLSKSKEVLSNLLNKIENLLYAVLVIIAGMLIKINRFEIFFIGLASYLILRYFLRYTSGILAYQIAIDKRQYSYKIGKGLISQGIVGLSILLNFKLFYPNSFNDLIFAVLVFAVLINQVLSYKTLNNLLIDLNEIK